MKAEDELNCEDDILKDLPDEDAEKRSYKKN